MKLRFVYNMAEGNWFQRLIIGRWNGKVLYPFVCFRFPKDGVSDRLFRHEMQHVYQIRRMGWLGFYIKYLWLQVKWGYGEHPFELEAKAYQNEPLTDKERALKRMGDM